MTRYIVLLISAFMLASCGVGSYSVSSGRADEAFLVFVDSDRYGITVIVDSTEYTLETVKYKRYRKDRNIRKTTENTIRTTPRQHEITVLQGKDKVYSKKLFISAAETKIIEL